MSYELTRKRHTLLPPYPLNLHTLTFGLSPLTFNLPKSVISYEPARKRHALQPSIRYPFAGVNMAPNFKIKVANLAPECYIAFIAKYQNLVTGRKELNMPILKEKERVSARIPIHAYQTLIRAAEISGSTLNQFLVQAAIEKAQTIIEKDQTINLSLKSASAFFNAIENPPKPTRKLREAMKKYRASFDPDNT